MRPPAAARVRARAASARLVPARALWLAVAARVPAPARAGVIVFNATAICPGSVAAKASVCAPQGRVVLDCGVAPAPPGFVPAADAPVCVVGLGAAPLALAAGAQLACTPATGCEIWLATSAGISLAGGSSIAVRECASVRACAHAHPRLRGHPRRPLPARRATPPCRPARSTSARRI